MNHPINHRRAARKAANRLADASAIAARVVAAMADGERELHVRLTLIASRVRAAMVADGHKVTSDTLPVLVTGGRDIQDPAGTMGLCQGDKVTVFRSAFDLASGIQRRVLIHELVHFFDADRHGEAYLCAADGHAEYLAQRCEVLARAYEVRASEFFV